MGLIERFAELIADLKANGLSGAGGETLLVSALLVLLVLGVFCAKMRDSKRGDQ